MTAAARLWIGLTAAPAAWIAQGLFGWFVGSRICTSMSIARVRLTSGVFSLAMLAAALWGLSLAWTNWRAVAAAPRPPCDRIEFMASGGSFVSVCFVIAIIWGTLNPLMLNVCGGMR
jgi:hypothetical protein